MLVKVLKLGEEEVIKTFTLGAHVIGRGPTLQCNDKRVSRNHATIEVTPKDVHLTSQHINPCFLKAANSKTITTLSKNATIQLNNGDTFSFLPDDYWFKVQIEEGDEESTKSEVAKRPVEAVSDDEVPPDKKTKFEDVENDKQEEKDTVSENNVAADTTTTNMIDNENNNSNNNNNSNDDDTAPKPTNEASEANRTEIDQSNVTVKEEVTVEVTSSQDIKQEPDAAENNPSTSSPRPRREKCWYGAECYRKNALHRQEYTHPGDSDFESDPEDNRPSCSYGATCYRKNKDHRRDYKHPPRKPPSKKKRSRKKVDRLNVADSEDMRDLDLSDSEDPFIVDDDSDEYVGDSNDDDSDFEDSQDLDEDSENVKRLVKEAKKFVKK